MIDLEAFEAFQNELATHADEIVGGLQMIARELALLRVEGASMRGARPTAHGLPPLPNPGRFVAWTPQTQRERIAAEVDCPRCKAPAGYCCVTWSGMVVTRGGHHAERYREGRR